MPQTFFEDLHVDQELLIGHWDLDESQIVEFAKQWDPQPFHIDSEAAAQSVFGGLTASSLHLFAICTRLFFDYPKPIATLAMLGKDEVRFPSPARVGDRLRYCTRCVEARPSRSKPDRGVVVLADRVDNDAGEPVMTQRVSLLVARAR
ncbi:MAG: MaoC/PaaZ C-terminal domain-containing protein [Myxococcales bacterium]|nr:MaoC/PaaZ C-terminal domain-containing protein [Myxococcales bacterium]